MSREYVNRRIANHRTSGDLEKLFVSLRELDKFASPYEAGIDCALYGPNEDNCHFGWFSTPERRDEWERGKRGATWAAGSPLSDATEDRKGEHTKEDL